MISSAQLEFLLEPADLLLLERRQARSAEGWHVHRQAAELQASAACCVPMHASSALPAFAHAPFPLPLHPQLEQQLSIRSCPHCGAGLEVERGVDLATAVCPSPGCGRRLLVEDAAAERAFRSYSQAARFRQCPRCSATVEKLHGCNHMTCRCGGGGGGGGGRGGGQGCSSW